MTAVCILHSVAMQLDRDAAEVRRARPDWKETASHIDNMAMRIREAIALIERGEFRQFEFKGIGYTRLPSGKIVRSA